MLTKLTLNNFKSWKCIDDMRLAPITGLFGTNSSGKTSILQWLLLIKQTIESTDRRQVLDFGDGRGLIDLGSFRDVIHGHTGRDSLSWNLDFSTSKPLIIRNPETPKKILFEGDQLTYSCEIAETKPDRLSVKRMGYKIAGHEFVCEAKADNGHYKLAAHNSPDFKFRRTLGRKWDLPAPVKCHGFPDQVNTYYQNAGFLADLQLAFEQQMSRVYYLGPLRDYPRRQYTWGGTQPGDMGQKGEKVIEAILSARDRDEKIARGKGKKKLSLEEYVADWLKQLDLIDSFEVKSVKEGSKLFQVHVRKTSDASPVMITDVGFGISQILPVITLCYYVPEGSTIILEQPEIHLHPKVQSGLADVLIDAVRVRNVQILVESHSEHLLRRLQRRIADETLTNDEVALYFCDFADGESKLVPLEVDLFGNIANWPKDFFGDDFGEMAEMTKAVMRRRQRGDN